MIKMKRKIIAVVLALSLFVSAFSIFSIFTIVAENTAEETGMIVGGAFETKDDFDSWSITQLQDRTVALDKDNAHEGDGSLSINMPTEYYSPSKPLKLISKTFSTAADSIDTYADYKAEMYIKTSEDFCGSVYIRLRQGNSYIQDGNSLDLLLLGTKTKGGNGFSEWIRLASSNLKLKKQAIDIVVYVNGTGKIWIDDIDIKVDKNLVKNGGFDVNSAGWDNWGSLGDGIGKSIEVTKDVACASAGSLKLSIDEEVGGMIYMANEGITIDPKKQYTLSMDVKCEDVGLGGAFVRIFQHYENEAGEVASSWLKCYGADDALTAGGTDKWQHFDIKLAAWEPTIINFNLLIYLQNGGTVYYDNIRIVEREKMVAAAGEIIADPEPGNIEPMTPVFLASSDDSNDIYYTVDGSDPSKSSTAYLYNENRGILVAEDMTVKACAVSEESIGETFTFDYKCPVWKIEEDALLLDLHGSSQMSLDTSVKKVGKNSIKIQGAGGRIYASTGDMRIDSAFDYKLEFWVKTENIMNTENAFVNLFLPGSGSMQNEIDGRYGAYVKTTNIIEGIKETQDWTHYEILIDELDEFWPNLNFTAGLFNDNGTMWIDGIKLTALPYAYYPLSIASDGKVFGNNYYKESLFGNFSLDQGFIMTNNTNNIESGLLTYSVYNDKDLENAIGGGDVNVSVFPHSLSTATINLTMCASYGTYTVKFNMDNGRGYSYYAGSIKVAVLRDVSNLPKNKLFGISSPMNDFDYFNKNGISIMRTDFHWVNAEPTQGTLNVEPRFDTYVEESKKTGIDLLLILGDGSGPSWFKPGDADRFPKTDTEIAQFINYVKMAVNYFKGKVKYYELYNETDIWPANNVSGKDYAKLLKAFYKAVKEVDPNAYVVAGATAGTHIDWAKTVFEQNVGSYMDFWSAHPYANPKSPEDRDWLNSIKDLEDMIVKNTGKKIPLILDEMGWSDNKSGGGANQQEQLKWCVRSFVYASSLDYVNRMCVYNADCAGTGNHYVQELRWGMYDGTFSTNAYAHPFAAGMSNYVYMTDGYKLSKEVKLADGLYSYKFTDAKKANDLYVLWTKDVQMKAKITTSGTSGKLYDIFGNAISVGYEGNTLETDVSGDVVYFTLDKKESIKKIELFNADGSKIEKKTDNDKKSKDNKKVISKSDDITEEIVPDEEYYEEYYDIYDEDGADEEPTVEKKLVRRKKIVKKVVSNNENKSKNYLPIIIGSILGVLLVGAGVFAVIFIKKRKAKRNNV